MALRCFACEVAGVQASVPPQDDAEVNPVKSWWPLRMRCSTT